MCQKCYLTLATGHVWLILYKLRLSHMGSDVGQIFQTASLHRDHSILCAMVYEKKLSRFCRDKYSDKRSMNKGPKRCISGCTKGCLT